MIHAVPTDVEAALREAVQTVDHLIDARAARHEAAHTVAAWVLGGVVEQATIVPSADSGGRVNLCVWLAPAEMAAFALAGSLAAGSSASDDQLAIELVGADGIDAARARARSIVEEHGAAVEAVAARLVTSRTMGRRELEALRLQLFRPGFAWSRIAA